MIAAPDATICAITWKAYMAFTSTVLRRNSSTCPPASASPPLRAVMMLARPLPEASEAEWERYLHLRDKPAGVTRELWHHEAGCSAWLVVHRDTVSHVIHKVEVAADVAGGVA